MKGLIPQDIIDEVLVRVDIVEIINEYVPLKREGKNFKGLCPFHHEKTPSFVVSTEKQIFHCFGCGEGGNVFGFIMKIERLTFPEAVKKLAQKTGVNIPEQELTSQEKNKIRQKERWIQINELASKFYHKILVDSKWGKKGLDYLLKRGITLETIDKFKLGFSLPSWDGLLNFMSKKGISHQELLDLGLILPKKQGSGYYDRFRDRIMFPIWDSKGRVVAFGGRVIEKREPKYLNSPDTPLFNKGHNLYGIHLAKSSIRTNDLSIIVEGYMDVISCHQYGVTNAVASLGTAFTKFQGKLLMRHSYEVGICYDGDAAGLGASLRGLDILSDLGCNVRVINLPKGLDPDEFLQKEGKDNFNLLVKRGQSLIEYKLSRAMETSDASTIQGKTKIVESILPDLLKMDSFVARESAIELISENLGLVPGTIMSELKKFSRNQKTALNSEDINDNHRKNNIMTAKNLNKAEVQTLKILLENNSFFTEIEKFGGDELFTPPLKELYKLVIDIFKEKGKITGNDFADNRYSQILSYILMQKFQVEDVEKAIGDYLRILRVNKLDKEYDAKKLELKEAEKIGDVAKLKELLFHIDNILQEKKSLIP